MPIFFSIILYFLFWDSRLDKMEMKINEFEKDDNRVGRQAIGCSRIVHALGLNSGAHKQG